MKIKDMDPELITLKLTPEERKTLCMALIGQAMKEKAAAEDMKKIGSYDLVAGHEKATLDYNALCDKVHQAQAECDLNQSVSHD